LTKSIPQVFNLWMFFLIWTLKICSISSKLVITAISKISNEIFVFWDPVSRYLTSKFVLWRTADLLLQKIKLTEVSHRLTKSIPQVFNLWMFFLIWTLKICSISSKLVITAIFILYNILYIHTS